MSRSDDKQSGSLIPLVVIGVILYSLFSGGGGDVPGPGPEPPGPTTDPLTVSHQRDRSSKIRILREMTEREFRDDPEQAKWWNSEIDAARQQDFQPFVDAVAEAIVGDRVKQLADQLEGR